MDSPRYGLWVLRGQFGCKFHCAQTYGGLCTGYGLREESFDCTHVTLLKSYWTIASNHSSSSPTHLVLGVSWEFSFELVMVSQPLPSNLQGNIDVLLIDNFDSFTWNLYQQLCLHGAEVTVIRNDAISPSVFPQLRINSLIISPGPGHPQTDSGISKEAIEYFQGKVPVLGVCMGLECLVDLYGGRIG